MDLPSQALALPSGAARAKADGRLGEPGDPAAIREAFLGFAEPMDSIEIDNLHVAARGDVVFPERIDEFRSPTVALDLPVAEVFEVRDGKIVAHRDDFDYQTWRRATAIPLG